MILALFFEILKYLLPAVVLYFIVRLIMQAWTKNEEKKREVSRNPASGETLPLRLQAYERLILLLERITPAQAVNRVLQPGMTTFHLQMLLIQNIREEFEHNVAQQIYVSSSGWAMIKSAKEEIIHLINISAAETETGADAPVLAKILLERWAQLEQNPVQSAIDQLKTEVRQVF